MSKYEVKFEPSGKYVCVSEYTTVLEAALQAGINLEHACGGNCSCTTCHVHIEFGKEFLDPPENQEEEKLEEISDKMDSSRLGCQTLITSHLIVRTPH